MQYAREIACVGPGSGVQGRERGGEKKKRKKKEGEGKKEEAADQVKWKIACRLRNKRWSSRCQPGGRNWLNSRKEMVLSPVKLNISEVRLNICLRVEVK
ncbi:hypothetical protein TNCT_429501 [Trichonephila clavata]|uniref:Uncharacterized protein n=1 Tax=Trichonephila clavata TaxID=2740835 RepID=A0A8X6FKX3_TRICU|nr:hypothetical protein TNCT_429501 [Trichonephila clavata]